MSVVIGVDYEELNTPTAMIYVDEELPIHIAEFASRLVKRRKTVVLSYKARNKSGELEVPDDLDVNSLKKRGLTPDVAGQLQKTYLNHAWLDSVKLDEFELGYQTKEESGYIVFKWFDEETIKEYAV